MFCDKPCSSMQVACRPALHPLAKLIDGGYAVMSCRVQYTRLAYAVLTLISRWMMPSLCRYARALATSRMITAMTCSVRPCRHRRPENQDEQSMVQNLIFRQVE